MIKSRLAGPRVILYKVGGYQGVGHQLSTINIQKLNVKNRLSTLNTVNLMKTMECSELLVPCVDYIYST